MGGYGAMKFGLKHPEMFAQASQWRPDARPALTTGPLKLRRRYAERKSNDVLRLAEEFRERILSCISML